MDEGEHYGADAFDLDDDVFVAADALDVAFVAGEDAAGDADALSAAEVGFVEDLAACGVGGGEEFE